MNEKLRDRLLKLTYGDVVDWVGEAVAARGFNYRDRVGEIGELPDGYAAHVQGTNSYVTNLYADEYGEFCSVCSCPVGVNCKHGAALALVVSEALQAGRKFVAADGEFRLERNAPREKRPIHNEAMIILEKSGEVSRDGGGPL